MLRNKLLIKTFAVFFILEIVTNTVWPSVSYALTAGPTAPEATSFEPVDTTDMVNPLTGDFVYNLPLLEVPGPAGGFPLSLSYHAGLMTDEEASWVGLGWTLNPGAINRHINGYADDHKDAEQTSRFYWHGGETHEIQVGVSTGIAGVGSMSAGLSIGYDTFQGFGVGMFLSAAGNLGPKGADGENTGPGFRLGFEMDPWGNPSMSMGFKVGIGQAQQLSSTLGVSTNFKSLNASASGSMGLLGASLSTNGTKFQVSGSVAGASMHNSKAGRVTQSSASFTLPIPFLHLGYNYTRYWIDEMEDVKTHGILNNPTSTLSLKHFKDNAYDSYSLHDNGTLAYGKDPATDVNGTVAAYDDYTVTAQGVSGSFKPYLLRGHTYRQLIRHYNDQTNTFVKDIVPLPTQTSFGNSPVNFRFVNDFSNQFLYTPNDFQVNTSNQTEMPLTFQFSADPITGENDNDGMYDNHLVGSKMVRQFTNLQVKNGVAGFIETKSSGFDRQSTPDEQLAGFQIINESGVTYHFSLPAYSRDEFQYSEDRSDVTTFNYTSKPEPYAYTWYLTAVTGPDYIDRGEAGLDEDDWGYWVELEYGKWSKDFPWRNPPETSKNDIDEKFRSFSEGVKDVYYLDAIRTKTHTALFIKNIRPDGKSALRFWKNETTSVSSTSVRHEPIAPNKNGGFIPKVVGNTIINGETTSGIEYTAKPVSSLKLEKIVLIDNSSLESENLNKADGELFEQSVEYKITEYGEVPEEDQVTYEIVDQHLPDNVLDIDDISGTLIGKALRVIQFNSDSETLCPETSNSFHHTSLDGANVASTNASNYQLKGKLALSSIQFLGKGGADLTPATNFSYDLPDPITGTGVIDDIDSKQTGFKRFTLSNAASLKLGDIITFSAGSAKYYASVYKTGATARIQILGKNTPAMEQSYAWTTTKNAPYNKEMKDEWGMYKGDYFDINNPRIDRIRTNVSKNHVDVWSLREIGTSTGASIKIAYESDSYRDAVLSKSYPLIITSASFGPTSTITFAGDTDGGSYLFKPGDKVSLLVIVEETMNIFEKNENDICEQAATSPYQYVTEIDGFVQVISGNSISISSTCLGNFFGDTPLDEMGEVGSCLTFPNESDNPAAREAPGGDEECESFVHREYVQGNLLIYNPDFVISGGDIRTTSITIEDPFTEQSNRTSYDYTYIPDGGSTSGVTPYAPNQLSKYAEEIDNPSEVYSSAAASFKSSLYNSFSSIISMASEIPPPGVMYEYVTIRESIRNQNDPSFVQFPYFSRYHYRVFEEGMIFRELSNKISLPQPPVAELTLADEDGYDLEFNNSQRDIRKVTIRDFTSHIGELKSVTLYDNAGTKISETTTHYLHDDFAGTALVTEHEARFNSLGRFDETFIDSRAVGINNAENEDDGFALKASITQRQRYPSIQLYQTTKSYKTGVETKSETMKFDFYSGLPIKTQTTDGYGNTYVTESVPAYRKYSTMGVAAAGGRNMLNQEAANYVYKIDVADSNKAIGLVSASIQTWSGEVSMLDHPELTSGIVFSNLYQKGSDGYYPARSTGLTDYLLTGDQVRFDKSGYTYLAKVISSIKNVASNRYDYKLQLITTPSEISSTATNVSVMRLTVPRKHASFSFIGDDAITLLADGLYPLTANQLPAFTAWNKGDAVPANWQRNSELTLYDVYSHALEASDLNNQFAATKMSVDQTQIFATVANAKYKEFCYSGAEDRAFINGEAGGDVVINGTVSSSAHTGSKGISATSGNRAFTFTINGPEVRTYKVSVWASKGGTTNIKYKFNGVTQTDPVLTEVGEAGGWHLFEASIAVPTSSITSLEIWCQASGSTTVFDDFRIRPFDAAMTSYVYNQWGELSHILDNNNLYTKFEYDGAGRLTATYRETLKRGDKTYGNEGVTKVSEVIYNYGKNN